MFLPEIHDLEHRIPAVNIQSIKVKRVLFGKVFFGKIVELEFVGSDGGSRSVKLYLEKLDEFMAAIAKVSDVIGNLIAQHGAPPDRG
jgi:hypothetical protein